MGRINTGGAKKRTGDNIALASSVSGTTLKLNPPKGYYDGVTGTVNVTDADFVANKILNGVNLFGIVGNVEKLNMVQGNVLSVNSGGFAKCEVNIGSRPKIVIWWYDNPTSTTQNEGGFGFDKDGNVSFNAPTYYDSTFTRTYETTGFRGIGTTFKVRTEDYAFAEFSSTGFVFYANTIGATYRYIAIY